MADARIWLDALAQAWRAERAAVRARALAERAERSLGERVALGIALDRLRIVDEQSAPGCARCGSATRRGSAPSSPR